MINSKKMKPLKFFLLILVVFLLVPKTIRAEDNITFLQTAKSLWQTISSSFTTYGGSYNIPPTNKTIDSSTYVTWVLYEYGYKDFSTQVVTKTFNETDWNAKYGWEEISVAAGEDVTSKLQPGDILVRDDGSNNGHMNITAENNNGTILAYDCGSKSNWENSGGNPVDKTNFAKNDERPGKIIRVKAVTTNSFKAPVCNNKGDFTKYDLTEDQLVGLASVAKAEGGNNEGVAIIASMMANLFEKGGSKYGTGGTGLYDYVDKGGYFGANAISSHKSKVTPSQEEINIVKNVLLAGKRVVPAYIDEYDCINCNTTIQCDNGQNGDICSITTNGVTYANLASIKNKGNYVTHSTTIHNVFGSSYQFYSFLNDTDALGYTSTDLRNKLGDNCYEYSSDYTKYSEIKNEETKEKVPDTSVKSVVLLVSVLLVSSVAFLFLGRKNYFKKI